jgi:protocatechuate 3,4-dioxygenase beta subunit
MRYLTHVAMFFVLLPGSTSLAWSAPRAQDPKETGTITGRVTLDGKPAQGAIVMATPSVSDPTKMMERILNATAFPKATTDPDGRYRLEGVPAGTYSVAPSAPTLVSPDPASRNKEVIVGGDATVERIDFSLTRGGVISGKITDSEGRPVIATKISLRPVGNAESSAYYEVFREDRMFLTDDRGIYRIFGLSPGHYLVSAGDSDNSPFELLFTGPRKVKTYYPGVTEEARAKGVELTAGAEALGVDIKLALPAKGFVVSGRVVDAETRKPVADTMVS